MTLDEAIQRYTDNAEYERTHDLQGCLEFKQLEKWLKELKQLREQTRWIPVSESFPKEHVCDDGYIEPSETVLVQLNNDEMKTSRYWGSRESRKDEPWIDLSYPTTLEVVAWMPLPEPYKVESEG